MSEEPSNYASVLLNHIREIERLEAANKHLQESLNACQCVPPVSTSKRRWLGLRKAKS